MRYGFPAARLGLAALAAAFTLVTTATADDYPNGCVDCHAQKEGPAVVDFRLNNLLRQIGHPRVDRLKTIPTACNRCHADEGGEDDGMPSFSQIIHVVHFDVPQSNTFVQDFGGKCQHCHAMDVDAGEAIVKSGERNW